MTISNKQQTIATIENALEEKRSAAIGEIVEIIQKLAANASTLSINELADIIGRDPTMVEKVIGSANTIGFKANVQPVLTISQAIHTVGYEKIRNLAIALVFAESTAQNSDSYEQREMAALSVCSGIMAQNLSMAHSGTVEPELVFVCATLRNFGKLLLSSFMIDEFRSAKTRILEMSEDDAFRLEFGITPLEVGAHFLFYTNVPQVILRTFRKVSAETLTRPAKSSDKALIFSALSTTICELIFDENLSPEEFEVALHDTLTNYRECLPIELLTIKDAIVTLEEELSSFNRLMKIPDERSPGSVKLKARQMRKNLPKAPKPMQRKQTVIEIEVAAAEGVAQARIALAKTIEEIASTLDSKDPIDTDAIYQQSAKAIQRSLRLENCLVFIPEQYEENKFSARYGSGALFNKVKNRPLVSLAKSDIFSISIKRKEDILIEDITAGKTRSIIPDWITDNSKTNAFIILPAVNEGKLFAIFFGSVAHGNPISLESEDIKQLREIRRTLAKFKKQAHQDDVSRIAS